MMTENYTTSPGFIKAIIVFLLALPLTSIAQTTGNTWRYLRIPNRGMQSVKSVTEIKVDTVQGLGLVIYKEKDRDDMLFGYIVNNTDTVVQVSLLDPFVDNCTTYILKEGKWTKFQITDHSGISCGNSYLQDELLPKKALGFRLQPVTEGALSVKIRMEINSYNYSLISNIVEISITDEQYKAAGKEIPPQHLSPIGAAYESRGTVLFEKKQYVEAKLFFEKSASLNGMTRYLSKHIALCDSLIKVGE